MTKIPTGLIAATIAVLHSGGSFASPFVYTYTGGAYDFDGLPCSPISDCPIPAGTNGVTITLESATALAPLTSYGGGLPTETDPITISIADGLYSANCSGDFAICGSGNVAVGAQLTTDASGNISAWSILAYTTPALSGILNSPQPNAQINLFSNSTSGGIFAQTNLYDFTVYGNGCCGDYGSTTRGSWLAPGTQVPVSVPEPGSLLLLGIAFVGLAVSRARSSRALGN